MSRSVRRRLARRRTAPAEPLSVQVMLQLRDIEGVFRSFLIVPGVEFEQNAVLTGYQDAYGRMERQLLPVTIRAQIQGPAKPPKGTA